MLLRALSLFFVTFLFASCQKESQVERATRDGILLMGNSNEPKGLDPQIVTGVLEGNILRALFEGLVQFHPSDDAVKNYGAAESIVPDETFTTWTIKLRPDAKWSDGVPVTAEDFAFSYERILTPTLGAKYAEMLYFLKGAEAFNKSEVDDFSTVGIKVTGPREFVLTLRGPTPYFKELLKHFTYYPVPKHQVLKFGAIDMIGNQWSKPKNIVGNGPFKLASYKRNDHIFVDRNPHYWDAEQTILNGIRYLPITNPFTEARMFRDGQLHITYTAAPEVVDLMKDVEPAVLRLEPYLGNIYYRFNTTREPLTDVKVRRALSLAVDREALCISVFRGFSPAHAMTPPMGDYQPPRGTSYDPEQARKLLAEAGFPNGEGFPRISLLIASSETNQTHAAAIQAIWRRELGVEIEVQNKDWTGYLNAQNEMEYDIAIAGWIGDYLDPLTFIEMWTVGNPNNNTGWENKNFTKALEESYVALDSKERLAYLFEAERLLLEDAPIAPVAWRGKSYLIHPDVNGWYPLLLDAHPFNRAELIQKPEGKD